MTCGWKGTEHRLVLMPFCRHTACLWQPRCSVKGDFTPPKSQQTGFWVVCQKPNQPLAPLVPSLSLDSRGFHKITKYFEQIHCADVCFYTFKCTYMVIISLMCYFSSTFLKSEEMQIGHEVHAHVKCKTCVMQNCKCRLWKERDFHHCEQVWCFYCHLPCYIWSFSSSWLTFIISQVTCHCYHTLSRQMSLYRNSTIVLQYISWSQIE